MHTKRRPGDILLRKLRLERSRRPIALIEHPEWRFSETFKSLVAHRILDNPDFFFVQIGAFDGKLDDPLYPLVCRNNLSGIVVEPQSRAIELLQQNYADQPGVKLIQAAISHKAEERDFYSTRSYASPAASFDKQHLIRHGISDDEIICQKVNCIPLMQLLGQQDVHSIDVLQIDAEGYDYEIIKQVDFDLVQPNIIRFEHMHLSDEDLNECINKLAPLGYRFINEGLDTIAIKRDLP